MDEASQYFLALIAGITFGMAVALLIITLILKRRLRKLEQHLYSRPTLMFETAQGIKEVFGTIVIRNEALLPTAAANSNIIKRETLRNRKKYDG